jgi:hypothetical protein
MKKRRTTQQQKFWATMSFPAKNSPEKMTGDGGGAAATAERHCKLFFFSRRSQRWLSCAKRIYRQGEKHL